MTTVALSLLVSLLLPVGLWLMARRYGAWWAFLLALLAFPVASWIPLIGVDGQAVFTALILFALAVFKARPATIGWMAAAVCLLSIPISGAGRVSQLQVAGWMREDHPLQSIAHRLRYETPVPEQTTATATPLDGLDPELLARLVHAEKEFDPNRDSRRNLLARLHKRTRDEFILSAGFGRERVPNLWRGSLDLPETEPIPLPTEPVYADSSPNHLASVDQRTRGGSRPPPKGNLLAMHDAGVSDFLSPQRFGYVQDLDHVAGFESHQFSKMPPGLESSPWQIVRLELVSLLKHDVPVAYISQNLPRMDELQEAPTRGLNSFEQQALETLRREEDLVTETNADRIRMLGSLRALETCLQCHSVQRGELLGALTYELVRVQDLSATTRERSTGDSARVD